ncbi:siderophore ABC transporter substrate-binding protein [Mesorhizobium sp. SB112]|uniref:siderophore ABC transporter substrate-binding protein n=1 Tax=Mesorhizobium sp. SB112 TaxID=3151853 RepID=UPI003266E0A8
MRKSPLVAGLAALIMTVSPLWAAEIETAIGEVDVAENPKTIAVFDIAAVDTLDRLGIHPNGIPDKLYLPELSKLTENAEVVGTLFEPDLEALNALAPDLIIVGGRSSPQVEAARRVAPTIDMTITGDDLFAEAKARLAAYGTIFDRADEAKKAQDELDEALADAKNAVKGKGKALIIMTNGPKVSAYGPGSRFGWVHNALELPAAVEDVDSATHGEAVSFEFIRKADPDWIIVLDRAASIGSGEQSALATLDNELMRQTKAWKNEQIVYLPPADFYIAAGGAQATKRVLGTISEAFSRAE